MVEILGLGCTHRPLMMRPDKGLSHLINVALEDPDKTKFIETYAFVSSSSSPIIIRDGGGWRRCRQPARMFRHPSP